MSAIQTIGDIGSFAHKDLLTGVRVLVIMGGIPLLGQERANIEVIRACEEMGLKALFVTHEKWGHQQIQPALGALKLYWTDAPFGPLVGRNLAGAFPRIAWGMMATSWTIWRTIRRWRPTHLHLMNWLYAFYALPILCCTRVPIVYRFGDAPPTHTAFHRQMVRLICRKSASIICVSKFVRREAIRLCPAAKKIEVIYSSPPKRPAALPLAPIQKRDGDIVVLYVGQVIAEKGILQLFEAAKELVQRNSNVVFWIAGKTDWRNPLAERLIAQTKESGLDERISFLGYIDNVPDLLSKADIHVCPSVCREALGNVILEAKAAGLPTVAFADGGIPELIEHGVDGLLCRDTSASALAESLNRYILNPAQRLSAGKAAQRSLQIKFAYDRFQREWASVFLNTWKH